MYRFAAPDKRRPVLVVSRDSLLSVLQTATVVAVTSTRRGSPIVSWSLRSRFRASGARCISAPNTG
ncbi:MAG: type II toxin-antitoxin system PemK/MazF family toxin [Myxococcaceae bacterium]|nr:type II toxin-antitoxin system PemK/MazF family toxin [Myxococcaceae bacterium]